MKKIILILGIIFLLIGVSIVSSVENISKTSSLVKLNNPPYVPSNPRPPDGATNLSIPLGLRWDGGDPDPEDIVLYCVYFGNSIPPPGYIFNISANFTMLSGLDFNTIYYWNIISWDEHGASTEGPIWSFKTGGPNNPPYIPSNPVPSDGSTDNPICPPNISWNGGDPDGDNVTYDIFFGECPPPLIATNVTNTWYQLSNLLEFAKNYCWKIVAIDEFGLITSGPIWTFKTEENLPPYPPSNPYPPHSCKYVPINATICWTGGDPNECDTVTYDVYFGVTNPPTMKSSNQTETCYDPPGDLLAYKEYFWTVVAWDSGGLYTRGPIWSFTTGINESPPLKVIISGPTLGIAGVEYGYTFLSNDQIKDEVRVCINWGDGNEGGIVFHKSGEIVKLNHTWAKQGKYGIRATVLDEYGCIWQVGKLYVIMPRDKSISSSLLLRFLDQFPLLQTLLMRLGLQ